MHLYVRCLRERLTLGRRLTAGHGHRCLPSEALTRWHLDKLCPGELLQYRGVKKQANEVSHSINHAYPTQCTSFRHTSHSPGLYSDLICSCGPEMSWNWVGACIPSSSFSIHMDMAGNWAMSRSATPWIISLLIHSPQSVLPACLFLLKIGDQ